MEKSRSYMKVLFLDVDGVLNAFGQTKQRFNGCYGICPVLASRLEDTVIKCNCKIVLSSTWRKYAHTRKHVFDCLPRVADRIIGVTPVLGADNTSTRRGEEISEWLRHNKNCDRFVIVDDEGDMGELLPYLVLTHGCEGLTPEIAEKIVKNFSEAESDQVGQHLPVSPEQPPRNQSALD
jgi:hypothetical protein